MAFIEEVERSGVPVDDLGTVKRRECGVGCMQDKLDGLAADRRPDVNTETGEVAADLTDRVPDE